MAMMIACSNSKNKEKDGLVLPQTPQIVFDDDYTVYGLACDGSDDTILYIMPFDCSDPIGFNIEMATHLHKVMGKIKVGDWVCLTRNANDSLKADLVIDLEQLKGSWCYDVMPKLRNEENMTPKEIKEKLDELGDSVVDSLFVPLEYGFTLKRNWVASFVGPFIRKNVLEESPVVYPPVPRYTQWHILNGRIVLSYPEEEIMTKVQDATKDISNDEEAKEAAQEAVKNIHFVHDTIDILYMAEDSLYLGFKDGSRRGYHRK